MIPEHSRTAPQQSRILDVVEFQQVLVPPANLHMLLGILGTKKDNCFLPEWVKEQQIKHEREKRKWALASCIYTLQSKYVFISINFSFIFECHDDHQQPDVCVSATLPIFQQFVTSSTRENKMLDLFYAKVKNSCISKVIPYLEKHDFSLIFHYSEYKNLV